MATRLKKGRRSDHESCGYVRSEFHLNAVTMAYGVVSSKHRVKSPPGPEDPEMRDPYLGSLGLDCVLIEKQSHI